MRRTALLILTHVSLLLGGCSDSNEIEQASPKACGDLRDHIVGLRVAMSNVDLAAHREALEASLGNAFLEQCQSWTPEQIRCGLQATELTTAIGCTP